MLELRIMQDTDIECVRSWRNSDLINKVSYNREYITPEMQRKWFDALKNDKSQIHFIITYGNENIGYAAIKGLDKKNKKCEFSSLYIGEEKYLHSGLGAVAEYKMIEYIFSSFDIMKISCEVLSFNSKVIQLHKRFGFHEEGILKKHYLLDGKFEDVYILALFKNIWLEKKVNILKILKI